MKPSHLVDAAPSTPTPASVDKALSDAMAETLARTAARDATRYGYCPRCGGVGVNRERRLNGNDRCENGHQYPSAHAMDIPWHPGKQPRPTPASVVETHRLEVPKCIYHLYYRMPKPDGSGRWKLHETSCKEDYHEWLEVYAKGGWETDTFVYAIGEPPCSKESGSASCVVSDSTTSTSSSPSTTNTLKSGATSASTVANGSNLPAWATPAILAACKPGERLRWADHTPSQVRAYPSRHSWDCGVYKGLTDLPESFFDDRDESYTVPSPAQACDGSGWINTGVVHEADVDPCPGCSQCKPAKHDGGILGTLRKIHEAGGDAWNNIADPDAYIAEMRGKAKPDDAAFREKVILLCGRVLGVTPVGTPTYILAREVLAMLEKPCPKK